MMAVDDESLEKAWAKVVGDGDIVYSCTKCLEIRDNLYLSSQYSHFAQEKMS
jgi:hypothetical protein